MDNIFNVNLFQQIVSGVVVLLISILLGKNTTKNTVNSKGWKGVVVISWVMILGGLYMISSNVNNGGIYNPYVGMGMISAFLGIILKYIGRFFLWWRS